MNRTEIVPGIYWVGAIDWDIRNFHGYLTQRGSAYNAYLIMDEKIVLVDTVKHYLTHEMIAKINEIVDLSRIDYIVSNHVEMDHSGALPAILKLATNAKIVTSPNGERGLKRHFKEPWNFCVVHSGDRLPIGKHTLQFVHTPMVHWPDSMVTFIPEEGLLMSNDAFGQHIATAARFDDETGWALIEEEAAKYFANIVLPYADNVKKALKALSSLKIKMIAPSHGIIWRSFIHKILEKYTTWAENKTQDKALIVYDSMWGSTAKMAYKLLEGLSGARLKVTLRSLKSNHISDIMTDLLESRLIAIGSPTLNNGMLPTVAAFLCYIKGLRPKNRQGFAFGSYGWGGQAVGEIEKVMETLGWTIPHQGIKIPYVPDDVELEMLKETGLKLGRV